MTYGTERREQWLAELQAKQAANAEVTSSEYTQEREDRTASLNGLYGTEAEAAAARRVAQQAQAQVGQDYGDGHSLRGHEAGVFSLPVPGQSAYVERISQVEDAPQPDAVSPLKRHLDGGN